MEKYKKGDLVKVWSLQSFYGGGFLEGEKAVVRQDQTGKSVIVCVTRKIEGQYKVDTSYEVYTKQCEPYIEEKQILDDYTVALQTLENIRVALLNNEFICDNHGSEKYL